MEKLKSYLVKIVNYFKTRGIGFYLLIPVVVLSVVISIIYSDGFGRSAYFSPLVSGLPYLSIACFAIAFFKPVSKYVPVLMFVLQLCLFLSFVSATYMHCADVFFSGIGDNILEQLGFHFSFVTIAYIINILLSIAAVFFRQYGKRGIVTEETL